MVSIVNLPVLVKVGVYRLQLWTLSSHYLFLHSMIGEINRIIFHKKGIAYGIQFPMSNILLAKNILVIGILLLRNRSLLVVKIRILDNFTSTALKLIL